jgi:uncharacterized membrane protein YkoI
MQSRAIALVLGLMLLLGVAVTPVGAKDGSPLSAAAKVAVAELANDYAAADVDHVLVTDEYTSDHNGVTHVYLRQTSDGLAVHGAEATVNVKDGVAFFSGSRFLHDVDAKTTGEKQLSPTEALAAAAKAVRAQPGAARVSPTLIFQKVGDNAARLAYTLEIAEGDHWWSVSVDAENGAVLSKLDYVDHEDVLHVAASTARQEESAPVKDAMADQLVPLTPPQQAQDGSSYRVYPIPYESPLDGGRHTVHNPADADASPYGWHDTNGVKGAEYTITRGNNVNAYHDTVGAFATTTNVGGANEADPASQPDGGAGLDFDHPIFTFEASPLTYRDAAVDNLFYMNNVMHDVTYRYGFNEEAGNFQHLNYSGLGLGNDAVNAEAQDGTYSAGSTSPPALNANFSTPADGTPGRMQMYLWVDAFKTLSLRQEDVVRPYSTQVRDGDLDNGVISHEYGHGVSNRLVGGPSNVSCLREHDEREGEGWSDWWAYTLTMRPGDDGRTPRGIGNYVVYYDEGRTGPGIRITPYSTDMRINPTTYNTVKTAAEPHGVGYVWATMLWDMYWNLVDEHGFNPNPYDSWETGGNNLAIQLVIDGMKMVPCAPGFVDARNAIIAADAALTGDPANGIPGENECLIWSTFARRGLGLSASQGKPASKTDGKEGYDVPAQCAPAP